MAARQTVLEPTCVHCTILNKFSSTVKVIKPCAELQTYLEMYEMRRTFILDVKDFTGF